MMIPNSVSNIQNPLKITERWKLLVNKNNLLMIFRVQRVLDLEGSGNFLALEWTNVFDAARSFLPLFATFGSHNPSRGIDYWTEQ